MTNFTLISGSAEKVIAKHPEPYVDYDYTTTVVVRV